MYKKNSYIEILIYYFTLTFHVQYFFFFFLEKINFFCFESPNKTQIIDKNLQGLIISADPAEKRRRIQTLTEELAILQSQWLDRRPVASVHSARSAFSPQCP